MSHNVWKCDNNLPAWEANGENCSAAIRAKGMVRVYTETKPDIIGYQEMSSVMADEIIRGLAEKGQRYALLWGKDTPALAPATSHMKKRLLKRLSTTFR